jgi:Uma2 family endonuclease
METLPRSTYEDERGKPMPSVLHSLLQKRLIQLFGGYEPPYLVFSELSLEIGDTFVTPDLSVYRDVEIDFLSDTVRMAEPPLLAVEIASPTQGMQDLLDKIRDLLDHGVQSCWLVVPLLKTITVFTEGMESNTHTCGTITDPVTDIAVEWDAVFATPGATPEA